MTDNLKKVKKDVSILSMFVDIYCRNCQRVLCPFEPKPYKERQA